MGQCAPGGQRSKARLHSKQTELSSLSLDPMLSEDRRASEIRSVPNCSPPSVEVLFCLLALGVHTLLACAGDAAFPQAW
jgi:hypothetical protein